MTNAENMSKVLQEHEDDELTRLIGELREKSKDLRKAETALKEDRVYEVERRKGRESRRTPWWYFLALPAIGAVEWLINYNSFLSQFGIPALAWGGVIVVAIVVAMASHLHGTLLKQPFRIEQLKSRQHLGALVGISIGLIIVFAGVVAVRYLSWSELNALGVEAAVWPKVATTLMFNVLVWIVGAAFAYFAHSPGYYTENQHAYDRARVQYDRAAQAVDRYEDKLKSGREIEDREQISAYVTSRRGEADTASSLLPLVLLAVALLVVQPATAQFSSEYDIDQFCSDANVAAAAPIRETVVYIDETIAMPEEFTSGRPASKGDRPRTLARALRGSEWYTQLESKLTASLMASEHVSVLVARGDGSVEHLLDFCWPGYGLSQQDEVAGRGMFERFFGANPLDELDTQRDVAFAQVRSALAEALPHEASLGVGKNYVRALSRDEGRLRNERGKFVRVIFYGGMVENSEYGAVLEQESPRDLARRAVERTSLRLGGASFYIYGLRDASEKLHTFWSELLRRGGGQLASMGSDLALVAKVPTALHRFSLEVDVAPPEGIRRGRATILVADGGEVVDGAVVLAGVFRSTLSGNLSCTTGGTACSSQCDLRTETARSVYFKSLPAEKLELAGTKASLEGYIGESDDGQPSRAYARVSAKADGCE